MFYLVGSQFDGVPTPGASHHTGHGEGGIGNPLEEGEPPDVGNPRPVEPNPRPAGKRAGLDELGAAAKLLARPMNAAAKPVPWGSLLPIAAVGAADVLVFSAAVAFLFEAGAASFDIGRWLGSKERRQTGNGSEDGGDSRRRGSAAEIGGDGRGRMVEAEKDEAETYIGDFGGNLHLSRARAAGSARR